MDVPKRDNLKKKKTFCLVACGRYATAAPLYLKVMISDVIARGVAVRFGRKWHPAADGSVMKEALVGLLLPFSFFFGPVNYTIVYTGRGRRSETIYDL